MTEPSLKLLYIISSANAVGGGGPIEGLRQLASINRKFGHQIEVATLDSPDARCLTDLGIPCFALGPSISAYGYTPKLIPWLRLHHNEFDAVIVNGLWQFGSFAAHTVLSGSSTPYYVFTHGMLDPWFKRTYPLKHLKKWLYWPWAEYRVLRDARAVLFTCEDERRLARRSFWLYRCHARVVNYGTPGPSEISPSLRDAQIRAFQLMFPAVLGRRCLLFLGRVHEKKGPDLLFRAFAKLLPLLPVSARNELHIVMAGPTDDGYAVQIRRLADRLGLAPYFTWTGMVTGDEKWGAFHAADAFILPSHQENFGIAVAEALACGVPVLISNQVNIWREIVDDQAGYAEPDTEAGTLALLQRWLATPPTKWAFMRHQRAVACFQQRFRIEKVAASLISTLRECCVGRSGTAQTIAPVSLAFGRESLP
jgi:glycosyltransferase involved in cell wall biosynthesis